MLWIAIEKLKGYEQIELELKKNVFSRLKTNAHTHKMYQTIIELHVKSAHSTTISNTGLMWLFCTSISVEWAVVMWTCTNYRHVYHVQSGVFFLFARSIASVHHKFFMGNKRNLHWSRRAYISLCTVPSSIQWESIKVLCLICINIFHIFFFSFQVFFCVSPHRLA